MNNGQQENRVGKVYQTLTEVNGKPDNDNNYDVESERLRSSSQIDYCMATTSTHVGKYCWPCVDLSVEDQSLHSNQIIAMTLIQTLHTQQNIHIRYF